ncbi:hypothetical protein QVA74_06085, partial [Staphylococcus haemolyticus]
RAENNQKIYKKDNFYIISIEIVFFSLIQELYVPDSFFSCHANHIGKRQDLTSDQICSQHFEWYLHV